MRTGFWGRDALKQVTGLARGTGPRGFWGVLLHGLGQQMCSVLFGFGVLQSPFRLNKNVAQALEES